MNPNFVNVRFRAELPKDGSPAKFGIVTACNPDGQTVASEKNEQATESLRIALSEAGHLFFPVTGGSPDFTHSEPGFGVLFTSRDNAISWGQRYQQEAIFWIVDGTVELVPCDGGACLTLGDWISLSAELSSGEILKKHTELSNQ